MNQYQNSEKFLQNEENYQKLASSENNDNKINDLGIFMLTKYNFPMINWNQLMLISGQKEVQHKRLTILQKAFQLIFYSNRAKLDCSLGGTRTPPLIFRENSLPHVDMTIFFLIHVNKNNPLKSHLIVSCEILLLLFQTQKCLRQWQIGASKVICLFFKS